MRCFLEAVFIFLPENRAGGGGGGGKLPHKSHIGMSPSGRVFVLFWFENENTFCPFWSRIRYGSV